MGLKRTPAGDANMIPLIIDAVEHYAMLGEVCARLRAIWGEQHDGHGAVGVVFDVAC